jgi:UDP-N-acetylmuramoyl-L-alanyl-D-glutamate--2,6-diaminopimelate ligase
MMTAEKLSTNWQLGELLTGLVENVPPQPLAITGLTLDSRQVAPGALFFALAGSRVHGRNFIDDAIARGAAAVLCEASVPSREDRQGVPVISVRGLKLLVGPIAERFYGEPSRAQWVVGVTGTNGKTSTAQFIAQALNHSNPCGVVGTLGNGLFGQLESASHTTPDAVSLHALLAQFRDQGATQVVMEVSSHGLEQGRSAGVAFDVAVFTNLSHEHLDYHGTMHHYGRAKRRLFEMPGLKYAVINLDDEFGRELLVSMPGAVGTVSYGFEGGKLLPSLLGKDLQLDSHGLHLTVESDWGHGELQVPLLGRFNAANLLAALGALLAGGMAFEEALQRLAQVQPVPGRMNGYGGNGSQPLVVVDYAHTPDALQQVLTALRAHCAGRLSCVFGCGGDRDRAKRPLMAKVAEQLADRVIITDDNPRGETPEVIVADMLAGLNNMDEVSVIHDRAAAIREAVADAMAEDVVLVAGKGHEDYQLVGEQRLAFSDAEAVQQALRIWRGETS